MQATMARYILGETAISALVTATINVVGAALSMRGAAAVAFRAHDVSGSLLPQSFMAALMSALVPMLLTHRRCLRGKLPLLPCGVLDIPRLLSIALLLATCSTMVFVPATRVLLAQLVGDGWAWRTVLLFNAAYGYLLAALATPAALMLFFGRRTKPWQAGKVSSSVSTHR